MLAVGEHLWGEVDDRIRRMTVGLAGGVGGSMEELCGALSGGALILGALYSRNSDEEDDEACNQRVQRYRERFIQEFGTSRCSDIRQNGYGSDGEFPCSVLVERATHILWDIVYEQEGEAGPSAS